MITHTHIHFEYKYLNSSPSNHPSWTSTSQLTPPPSSTHLGSRFNSCFHVWQYQSNYIITFSIHSTTSWLLTDGRSPLNSFFNRSSSDVGRSTRENLHAVPSVWSRWRAELTLSSIHHRMTLHKNVQLVNARPRALHSTTLIGLHAPRMNPTMHLSKRSTKTSGSIFSIIVLKATTLASLPVRNSSFFNLSWLARSLSSLWLGFQFRIAQPDDGVLSLRFHPTSFHPSYRWPDRFWKVILDDGIRSRSGYHSFNVFGTLWSNWRKDELRTQCHLHGRSFIHGGELILDLHSKYQPAHHHRRSRTTLHAVDLQWAGTRPFES